MDFSFYTHKSVKITVKRAYKLDLMLRLVVNPVIVRVYSGFQCENM